MNPSAPHPHRRRLTLAEVRRRRRSRAIRRVAGLTVMLCVAAGGVSFLLTRRAVVPSASAASAISMPAQSIADSTVSSAENTAAKEKAAAVVNPPGYSEHNCGLAADLNSPEHTGLARGFEKTAAFRWLCEHAGDYGFILRYPKDAEDKTEIIYEPWHWRYVGVENAAKINASGLCFEEYIETLQSIAAKG